MPARTMGVLEPSMYIIGRPSTKRQQNCYTSFHVTPRYPRNPPRTSGENNCILRASESVFWPGFAANIRQMVKNNDLCSKNQPAQPKLPIMQPDLPTRPWEELGMDILGFNGNKYLMIVDYCSRFPVMGLLNGMTRSDRLSIVLKNWPLLSQTRLNCP